MYGPPDAFLQKALTNSTGKYGGYNYDGGWSRRWEVGYLHREFTFFTQNIEYAATGVCRHFTEKYAESRFCKSVEFIAKSKLGELDKESILPVYPIFVWIRFVG